MNINQIAIRFNDHPNPTLGSTPIEHPYRQRWWLPIIGPTSTCLLNHLAPQAANDDWHLTQVTTLAATIGLGKGTGRHSPLLKSIDRLIRFDFGHYDLEPSDHTDPCITLYRTTSLPPAHMTQNWPTEMQQAHALDLADLYHQTH